jgi:glyoxylase-like metal-dependent hydrolase (beta-lactamase superfamily II)
MELKKISERVHYIEGPANIGVILLDNSEVALIDSGIDSRYASRVLQLLENLRFKVKYIFNTHSHADHIGGNSYLNQKTSCKIFSSQLELPTILNPLIQSAVLFAGAPIQDLLNKYILAAPSPAQTINDNPHILEETEIATIELPGHSINQLGYMADGVAFLGDSLFHEAFFKRQQLPFHYDPLVQLRTLERLKSLKANWFVGGHFKPTKEIRLDIETNISQINNAIDFILSFLKIPHPQDRVIKTFMDHFSLKKNTWEYFLYRATVNGYLSALYKNGQIKYRIIDNLLMWYAL